MIADRDDQIIFSCFIFLLLFVTPFSGRSQEKDITIVNVFNLDNQELAKVISSVNSYKPKVLSIDMIFHEFDAEMDWKLAKNLEAVNSLVMAMRLDELGGQFFLPVIGDVNFYPDHAKNGYSNPMFENDLLNTVKRFRVTPKNKFDSLSAFHFAIQVAMLADQTKTAQFIESHPDIVDIDYKDGRRCFNFLSGEDVLNARIKLKDVNDKIVIIGNLDPEIKFATPVRDKKTGAMRRMSELEINANIIAQILE
ncbi:MAG: CHASE2 domain-containing protein [Bacteroidota bacterium]